jgi:hypothetical protein
MMILCLLWLIAAAAASAAEAFNRLIYILTGCQQNL